MAEPMPPPRMLWPMVMKFTSCATRAMPDGPRPCADLRIRTSASRTDSLRHARHWPEPDDPVALTVREAVLVSVGVLLSVAVTDWVPVVLKMTEKT